MPSTISHREGNRPRWHLNVIEAYAYAHKRGWRVIEHVSHPRGTRLNVITRGGAPRTLRVQKETT